MAIDYKDIPIEECARNADKLIRAGAVIFQKFTCENCGQRLTMTEPNTFFRYGTCDQCGHKTEIKKCGYAMMVWL
jgi:hypothetical protein